MEPVFQNDTLREQYPVLYRIVRHKDITLQRVMENSPPTMTFRRNVVGPRLANWNKLVQRLAPIQLVQKIYSAGN
jgi:hypothetical protein